MMELMVVHPHIFWLSLGGGRRFVLESPLVNGRGHMRVGDSSWPVSASEDLGAGTHVEVIAIEGITLHIRAVSS